MLVVFGIFMVVAYIALSLMVYDRVMTWFGYKEKK